MHHTPVYAIDFGTSNSLLAAAQRGTTCDPIELDEMNGDPTILRSLMYFPKTGEPLFGQSAIKSYTGESGEGRFIRSIKKYLPAKSFTGTRINNKSYSIEDLIGCFLREMKRRADLHFNQDVKAAVLGRPAKFSLDIEKDKLAEARLQGAAKLAGFESVDFFPEPLAAAYSYRQELNSEKLVLVVDLGGGTSDFTVIKVHPNAYRTDDVLSLGGIAVAGDSLDGGIMTNKVAPHLGSQVKYKLPLSHNILTMPASLKFNLASPADITLMSKSDVMSFLHEVKKCTLDEADNQKLNQLFYLIDENLGFSVFEEIERAKQNVCSANEHYSFVFDSLGLDIPEQLNYGEFILYSQEKLQSILDTLDETVSMAQVKYEDIDSICCTGGTSKVPAIKDELANRFGAEKIHTFKNFHSVIRGLAERALELGT